MTELDKIRWLAKMATKEMYLVKSTEYDIIRLWKIRQEIKVAQYGKVKKVRFKSITYFSVDESEVLRLKREYSKLEKRMLKMSIIAFRYSDLMNKKIEESLAC